MKDYKLNKENYKGSVAEVATIIRVAVTNKVNTPDLYEIMKVITPNITINRIKNVIDKI